MKYILLILSLIFLSIGCNSQEASESDKAAILQVAIDASLKLDRGLNTEDFYIDFSHTNYFDDAAINQFLKSNSNFKRVNGDSLLEADSTWIEYGYLNKMLISINNVEMKEDSMIIELGKVKAMDGSNGIEIILEKDNGIWKVVSSKITWIS